MPKSSLFIDSNKKVVQKPRLRRSIMYKYSPIVLAICLAACGGGSDDSSNSNATNTTPTISLETQQAIASEVVSNALLMSGTVLESTNVAVASQITGQQAISQSLAMRDLVSSLKLEVEQQATPSQPQVLAAAIATGTKTLPSCSSGSADATFTDSNGNGEWDVNESGSVVFTNCVVSSGFTLNGKFTETYTGGTKKSPTNETSLVFENLVASKDGFSNKLISGTARILTTLTKTGTTENYKTTDLSIETTANSKTVASTLNEDLTIVETLGSTTEVITGYGSLKSSSTNINGTMDFKITKDIYLSTVEPISISAGQMNLTATSGASLLVDFATPTTGSVTLTLTVAGQTSAPKVVNVSEIIQAAATKLETAQTGA